MSSMASKPVYSFKAEPIRDSRWAADCKDSRRSTNPGVVVAFVLALVGLICLVPHPRTATRHFADRNLSVHRLPGALRLETVVTDSLGRVRKIAEGFAISRNAAAVKSRVNGLRQRTGNWASRTNEEVRANIPNVAFAATFLITVLLTALYLNVLARSRTKNALDVSEQRFQILARDVTATHQSSESFRRAKELLCKELREHRECESKFQALLDAAPDALMVTDSEGKIALANKRAEQLFGYRREELLGCEIQQLIAGRFRQVYARHRTDLLARSSARPAGIQAESAGLRKDGREFPVGISLQPLTTNQAVWITVAVRDLTEQKNRETAIRSLSGQLLHIQEEERRRIARDLHDSAGQALCALLMALNALRSKISADPKAVDFTLAECIHIAEESTKEVRTASYLLYPPMLEELGLKSAIPTYLEGFAKRSGIRTTCEISPALRRLPSEVELALFRVLQESLTNVHRHSCSRVAYVQLTVDNGMAILEVKDEGKGIPAEYLQQFHRQVPGRMGVGLRGMNERMRQLGGEIAVTSTLKGTTVTAKVSCTMCAASQTAFPSRSRPGYQSRQIADTT